MARHRDLTSAEVGWSLLTTRTAFEHRAVILGRDRQDMTAALHALAADQPHPALACPAPPPSPGHPGPVLVFPGQGSQWAGMGADLLDTCPVFAARIADCQRALARHVGWDLAAVLREGTGLDRVEVVQPVLWAVMVSLAAVWASYGVVPAAVAGHSQGEIAAACVAGALSLDDAATVVAVRAAALRDLSGRGAMASLGTGPAHAARLIAGTATGTPPAETEPGPAGTAGWTEPGPATEPGPGTGRRHGAAGRNRDRERTGHTGAATPGPGQVAGTSAGVPAGAAGTGWAGTTGRGLAGPGTGRVLAG